MAKHKTPVAEPSRAAINESRSRVLTWFTRTAPGVQWAALNDSPLGTIYLACSKVGLCSVDFGVTEDTFIEHLDPLAHTTYNPDALKLVITQLTEYFSGKRRRFDVPVDLSRMTPFQQSVLRTTATIPAGRVWTYGQMAHTIGKPRAGRAVGQALGSNPVPIIVPCHRVVGSDGSMVGYSGGGGIASKKWLLRLEGAL
jgi:methylated-DNA-[protein]-cysteine S-methyltransferase